MIFESCIEDAAMSVWLRLFILPDVLGPSVIHYDTLARKAWRSILVSTVCYVILAV